MLEKMLLTLLGVTLIGLTGAEATPKFTGWLQPSIDHYSATDVDANSPDLQLQEFRPESSYVDLKFTWSNLPRRRNNANFVMLTFLYESDGSYIGRAALYYFIRQGRVRR